MSSATHTVHDVKVTAGWDHPLGTTIAVDGRPIETARSVDIHMDVHGLPTVHIVHDCSSVEYAGVATIEHRCGAAVEPADSPTGYLGALKVALRSFASDLLLTADVYGLHRETVLEDVEEKLEHTATTIAHAVLAGAPHVMLRRPDFDGPDSDLDVHPDELLIGRLAVLEHDLDPGVHAVIRLPQAST